MTTANSEAYTNVNDTIPISDNVDHYPPEQNHINLALTNNPFIQWVTSSTQAQYPSSSLPSLPPQVHVPRPSLPSSTSVILSSPATVHAVNPPTKPRLIPPPVYLASYLSPIEFHSVWPKIDKPPLPSSSKKSPTHLGIIHIWSPQKNDQSFCTYPPPLSTNISNSPQTHDKFKTLSNLPFASGKCMIPCRLDWLRSYF